MKQPLNITIEEKLVNWVKGMKNTSEFINKVLNESYDKQSNPMVDLEQYLEEEKERNNIKNNILNNINKILEEGNKIERAEAERILKIEARIRERDKEELKSLTNTIKEIGVFDELMMCKDMVDINKVTRKLKENKILNPNSSTGIFGMMELKRVVEANKGDIKIDAEKFAEHIVKLEEAPTIKVNPILNEVKEE